MRRYSKRIMDDTNILNVHIHALRQELSKYNEFKHLKLFGIGL